ncbi:MAG: transporter substrate-binding domain-containing protein [Tissierellia bacterium]|nr:transporter substrate-binding domain-containing protein [Tissierellia bacterium]
MKRILSILTIIIILFTSSSSRANAHKRVIKIGGDNNYPPYEFTDEDGNFRGFNVDMMRAIGIELGLEIELIPMSWQEAMEALERGEVDAIQGMTKSKIREEKFDFTLPLVTNSQAIFVLKDTNYISSIEDLKGRKASFQEGDISYELSLEVKNIIHYIRTNQEEAIDLLLDGQVDAFIGNRLTGIYYLQKEGNFDKVKIVGEPMHETEYCVSVLKGNSQLLELFNSGIEAIKKNGTYDKIYKKWFGETFNDKTKYFQNLLYVSITILLIVSIIAFLNLYWNKNLKKKVTERTEELNILNKELREQKQEIEKSNKLKGKILESILSGIIVFDNKDRVIEYNKAAERILNKKLCIEEDWTSLNLGRIYGLNGYDIAKKGKVMTDNKEISISNKKLYINYSFIPINKPGEGIILLGIQ